MNRLRAVLWFLILASALPAVEVNLIATASSVTEGGSVTLIATRDSNVGSLNVPVAVGAPSLAALSSPNFSFAAGSSTATVTLNTALSIDSLANGARQVTAQINVTAGVTSTFPAATIGIRDDDVTIHLEAVDVQAGEDVTPADTAQLRLVVAGVAHTSPLDVQFEVHGTGAPGTGTFEATLANNDFLLSYTVDGATTPITAINGIELVNVSFPVGTTEALITLTPLGDTTPEGGETCEIRLPTFSIAYTVAGSDRSTMTIADDDNRVSSLTGTPAFESGPDGNIHVGFLSTFPVAVQIPYLISGVANDGSEVTILPGYATLAAGQTSVNIPIDALGIDASKDDDSLTLTLLPSADYVLPGTPSVTIPIVDRAGTASIAAPPASAIESVPGSPLSFGVTVARLADFTNANILVPFRISGGTAGAGEFSVGGTGVTWNAGSATGTVELVGTATTATIDITPIDDQLADGNKTVQVVLEIGQSVTVNAGSNSATGTILDNEPVVTITRTGSDPAIEGGAGIVYTIAYDGVPTASTLPVAVRFTLGGTAALADRSITGAVLDGNGLGGTATIPANLLSTTLTISAVTDSAPESVETVVTTLVAGTEYSIGSPGSDSLDLIDADATPTVEIATVADAIEARSISCFNISRTGSTAAALVVKLAAPTPGNGATAGDLQTMPTSVTIPVGAAGAMVAVAAISDGPDPNETVTLALASDAAYHLGTSTSATCLIVDGFADSMLDVTSEPGDVVLGINDSWSSVCRLNLPGGLTAGRTRASLTTVPSGSAPPGWLSVQRTSVATATATAVFSVGGSPPIGTSSGQVQVRVRLEVDIDANGTYELEVDQDLLLWVLAAGGAG